MEIVIHDSSKLSEIQDFFHKHFPHLKLEFFREKGCSKEDLIKETDKTLAEVRRVHKTGHLSINGHQKVSTLENHCIKDFGIYVQVFRKSGNVWLETTATDEWTLSEQNKLAEEMEKTSKAKIEKDSNYSEQF